MAANKRREREIEVMKELILSSAAEIMAEEGMGNISIRKIAARIEYSPAIIYHYFKDKDEIINELIRRGFGKIVMAVSSVSVEEISPLDRLKVTMRRYVEAALDMPSEFLAVQVSDYPGARKHTSSLYRGAARENAALSVLYNCIMEINHFASSEEIHMEAEHAAQLIAASAVGFIIKMIMEKNLDEEQKQSLINSFCDDLVPRMANMQ